MTRRLSRTTIDNTRISPHRTVLEPGIVHLGLGNFHRAHQAVATAQALDAEDGPWGVIGVASRSPAVVDALRAQNGLYTVLSLSPKQIEPLVVGVHHELLVAADQPDTLIRRLADPRTKLVTVTVTERGYTYSASTGGLDRALPQVQADLAGAPPRTTIGQLARGLQQRCRDHGDPLTVLSCDNLSHNGTHTQSLVLEFIEALPDTDAADLHDWVKRNVAFPSTMVDRIVPTTTDEHRGLVAALLGVRDEVPVPAEPFSMWVLEDRFIAGRPRWEAGGAIFTDAVEPYELLKLRLLNGTHSLIAYLGLLAGARHIAEAIVLPEIRQAAEVLMREEMLPTLDVPAGVDIEEYMAQLFLRFGNTQIGHRASQVGSDGSLKVPVRITQPVLQHAAAGRVPRLTALLVAAYIRCLATPESYDAATQVAIRDPYQDTLRSLGQRYSASRSLVRAVFDEAGVFAPQLGEITRFVDVVAELHEVLVRRGPHAAATQAATG